MAGLIIEIINRGRSATIMRRFDSLPVRVGRGYQNDLILTDPFVSPEHIRISEDETGFVVEDLDSDNGVYVGEKRAAGKSVHVISGDRITLGGTTLRLLSPSHPVPATLKLSSWSRTGEKPSFRILAWASLLPTLAVLFMDEYLKTFAKVRFSTLAKDVTSVIILVFLWAGLWSLIGYSVKRQSRFHAQLLVGNAFVIAITCFEGVLQYLSFSVSCNIIWLIGNYLNLGILLSLLLFFSLGFATSMRTTRRIIASISSTAVVILIALIHHFADKQEFNPSPDLTTILKPPYVKLAPSLSIDEFMKKSAGVFAKSRDGNTSSAGAGAR